MLSEEKKEYGELTTGNVVEFGDVSNQNGLSQRASVDESLPPDMYRVRVALVQAAETQSIPLAALSKMLGKDPSYLHQFVKRHTPKHLDEAARKTLSKRLGIHESQLAPPGLFNDPPQMASPEELVAIQGSVGDYGNIVRADTPLGWVQTNPRLAGVVGVYVLEIRTDHLAPFFHRGDHLFVHPTQIATSGNLVIVGKDERSILARLPEGDDTEPGVRLVNEPKQSDAVEEIFSMVAYTRTLNLNDVDSLHVVASVDFRV